MIWTFENLFFLPLRRENNEYSSFERFIRQLLFFSCFAGGKVNEASSKSHRKRKQYRPSPSSRQKLI